MHLPAAIEKEPARKKAANDGKKEISFVLTYLFPFSFSVRLVYTLAKSHKNFLFLWFASIKRFSLDTEVLIIPCFMVRFN